MVFLLVTIMCLKEYYSLIKSEEVVPGKIWGIITASLLFVSFTLASTEVIEFKYLFLNIPLIFLVFVFELFKKRKNNLLNISYSMSGVFYIALPLSLLNFFYNPGFIQGESNYRILLGFFFLVWIYDVAAYLVGSSIGRHKLYERISPKKTWEGSIGGAIICMISAFFFSKLFAELSVMNWMIIAAIIVLFGTLGDLIESMFKRNVNVKDSGSLLPGHGGLLDRFDSVLFASPFVFVYLLLIT